MTLLELSLILGFTLGVGSLINYCVQREELSILMAIPSSILILLTYILAADTDLRLTALFILGGLILFFMYLRRYKTRLREESR